MNIRFIIVFSLLMPLLSGSVQAMRFDQRFLCQTALKTMEAGFITDDELKNQYNPDIVSLCRSILTLRDELVKMGDDRDGKVNKIKDFLKQTSNRERAIALMQAAKYGECLVQEACNVLDEEEYEQFTIKLPSYVIDGPSSDASNKEEPQVIHPIVRDDDNQETKQSSRKQSWLRSKARYIVPVAVLCSGAVGVLVYHYLTHKK